MELFDQEVTVPGQGSEGQIVQRAIGHDQQVGDTVQVGPQRFEYLLTQRLAQGERVANGAGGGSRVKPRFSAGSLQQPVVTNKTP